MEILDLTKEEEYLKEVILSARRVQELLWGEFNGNWGLEEWRRMFRKRNKKIDDIDIKNPHAVIEMKKRLLQNAALSVALINILETTDIKETDNLVSNLKEYKKENIVKRCWKNFKYGVGKFFEGLGILIGAILENIWWI